jgi:archaellum component FlaD/FlaE
MELNQKMASLENELRLVKGEVKKLLVDIREIMNNMENPFYDVQNKSAGGPSFEIHMAGGGDELPGFKTSKEREMENKDVKSAGSIRETVQESDKYFQPADKPERGIPQDLAEMLKQYEEMKHREDMQKEVPKEMPKENPGILHENGIDIFTLTELMRWTDHTLMTIGRDKLDRILDLYTLTGHLSQDLKDIVKNIANLSDQDTAEDGAATVKDHITVISHLNVILNPNESDQRVLRSIYEEMPWRKVL